MSGLKGVADCRPVVGARLIISGMCDSHLLISVLKPLYGLEICLLLVSIFKYIAEHFDKRVNATMYLLGYQAMLYVGNVVVSAPAGQLYDKIGFEKTYIIMGCIALAFTLISSLTLCLPEQQRPSGQCQQPEYTRKIHQ